MSKIKKTASHLKEKQLTANQVMMGIRVQLFNLIIFHTHAALLKKDKQYFKDYCKAVGIPERKMRSIINGTYDGTLPDLIVHVRRATGMVVDIQFESHK